MTIDSIIVRLVDLARGPWILELGTWILELGTWNLDPGTWILEPKDQAKAHHGKDVKERGLILHPLCLPGLSWETRAGLSSGICSDYVLGCFNNCAKWVLYGGVAGKKAPKVSDTEYRDTEYRDTGIQGYRDTGIQGYRDTKYRI